MVMEESVRLQSVQKWIFFFFVNTLENDFTSDWLTVRKKNSLAECFLKLNPVNSYVH